VNNHSTLIYKSSVNGGAVGDHYWTYGYYRNPQTSITNILYLDTFARAATFDRVVQLAFGTPTPPPTATPIKTPTPTPTKTPTPTPTSTRAPKPGDANGDGLVNEADYTIWLAHFPQQVGGGASVGDFNGDGHVNGTDYAIWLNNYGG
jgi:hypothetical protein